VRASESNTRSNYKDFSIRGKTAKEALTYSLEHAVEVFKESKTHDEIWDCTLIQTMRKNKDTMVNPIVYWTDEDVWNYIKEEKIEVNPLYQMGYERVGCVGCPMAGPKQRLKELQDFPSYQKAYYHALERMIENRKEKGLPCNDYFENADACFAWWLELPIIKGQISLFNEEYEDFKILDYLKGKTKNEQK